MDPDYAQLTLDLRIGRNPAELFDRLHALGLVRLHEDAEALRAAVAAGRIDGAAITAATNDSEEETESLLGIHRTTLRTLALEGRAPVEPIRLTRHKRVYRRIDVQRLAGLEQ